MTHARARTLLYDHVMGQISDTDRIRLMEHLSGCRPCSDHLQRIETTVRLLSHTSTRPSERLGPEYWKHFSRSVELRLREEDRSASAPASRFGEWLDEMVLGRRRTLALAGVALATVVVLSFLVRFPGPQPPPSTTANVPVQGVQAPPPSPQVHQYLRRSRALLVGLENLEVPARKAVDLRTERKLSRELLQQAKELQERPMDLHTARLVGDVERVLLEIANTDGNATQHVEVIRGGIRQENLLFKLRMAEAAYVQTVASRRNLP
jgi:hypothetical protein